MNNNDALNHEKYDYGEKCVTSHLDRLCGDLDQQHPLERKIKFLLDIRGYIKVNKIKGSYIEFGSYKSEMQYCAYNVLEGTECVTGYIGLDTYAGQPRLSSVEAASMKFIEEGSFNSEYEISKEFVKKNIGPKAHLIKGDFRNVDVIQQCNKYCPISIAVIDCNLKSSIESSLKYTLKNIKSGGIIFIDDYFTNFSAGKPLVHDIFTKCCEEENVSFIEHSFYAPFAKSFIVYRR